MYFLTLTTQVKTHLHHEQECVEYNEGHDEVFEGRGDNYSPHFVLKTRPFTRHIPLQRTRLYREVYARFLKKKVISFYI